MWGDDGDVMYDAITSGPITHDQIDMIVSPNGLDANDLLQKRVLDPFLLARLPTIAQQIEQNQSHEATSEVIEAVETPEMGWPASEAEPKEPFPSPEEMTYDRNRHVKDYEGHNSHDGQWDAIDEARLFIECSTKPDDRFAIYKTVLFDALVEYLIDMEMRVITENEFYALLEEMNIETSEDLILSRISLIESSQQLEFVRPAESLTTN